MGNLFTKEDNLAVNCKWHDQLQKKIKSIENIISSHESKILNESETNESRKLNQRFEEGGSTYNEDGEKIPSKWEKIKTFYRVPQIFKMRELQMLVEDDIKGKDPSMSQGMVKKEVLGLSKRIVFEIKKEIKAKYQIEDDRDLERKVHRMMVKEGVDEHLRLMLQNRYKIIGMQIDTNNFRK